MQRENGSIMLYSYRHVLHETVLEDLWKKCRNQVILQKMCALWACNFPSQKHADRKRDLLIHMTSPKFLLSLEKTTDHGLWIPNKCKHDFPLCYIGCFCVYQITVLFSITYTIFNSAGKNAVSQVVVSSSGIFITEYTKN